MVRALVLIYEAGKGAEFFSEHSLERSTEASAGDLSAQPTAASNSSNNSSSSSDSEQQHVLELLAALDSLMQPRPARPDVSGTTGDGGTVSTSEYNDDSRARGRSNGTNTNVVRVSPLMLFIAVHISAQMMRYQHCANVQLYELLLALDIISALPAYSCLIHTLYTHDDCMVMKL
jgi:hypothetical protein